MSVIVPLTYVKLKTKIVSITSLCLAEKGDLILYNTCYL